ncbi:hypothetical protein BH24CHL7_BH24CHL7_07590 [soil metagenome]
MTGSVMARPMLSLFPAGDPNFRAAVEASVAVVGRRAARDPAMLAAMDALLRSSYPLASVQVAAATDPRSVPRWDVFRDGTVLDDELCRRARSGDHGAVGQLYDRHHRLAHAVSFHVAASSDVAPYAVVAAFHSVVAQDRAGLPVRVSIAVAAREAAIGGSPLHGSTMDPIEEKRFVLELAHVHRLKGTEIATVLGLEFREVARLANAGLRAFATRTLEEAP